MAIDHATNTGCQTFGQWHQYHHRLIGETHERNIKQNRENKKNNKSIADLTIISIEFDIRYSSKKQTTQIQMRLMVVRMSARATVIRWDMIN